MKTHIKKWDSLVVVFLIIATIIYYIRYRQFRIPKIFSSGAVYNGIGGLFFLFAIIIFLLKFLVSINSKTIVRTNPDNLNLYLTVLSLFTLLAAIILQISQHN